MRNKIMVLFPLACAAAVAGYFFVRPSLLPAVSSHGEPAHPSSPLQGNQAPVQPAFENPPGQSQAKTFKPELPIARVILYSSGVGYFERDGKIDGNAALDFSFPVQDINDLLKSMVLQDLGGGIVHAVHYDSHEPLGKTLQGFAVNLTHFPTFAQILNQARGEKVEVVLKQGRGTIAGTVMNVETMLGFPLPDYPTASPPNIPVSHGSYGSYIPVSQQVRSFCGQQPNNTLASKNGKDDGDLLNLWCTDGMRSVPMKEVERIRFLNPKMENEIQRALEVLASSHDTQKKTVTLNFQGQGQRRVKVGYVVENPLWRTSYRLLIGKDGKLFVQGWAVVENPSTEDWKDVKISLVSGRPISFKMDLYQPLYVPRQIVQPELHASIRPQIHGGAMTPADGVHSGPRYGRGWQGSPYANPEPYQSPPPGMAAPNLPTGAMPMPSSEIGSAESAGADAAPALSGRPFQGSGQEIRVQGMPKQNPQLQQDINFEKGVVAAATAADLGSFFQYVIEHPVTVPRQKSAMVPIVNKPLEGKKISLYNKNTHTKYPLLALQLKNTTGLHLMAGPIAVFEGSSYSGDALLSDLQPNEERLVSFAIDTGTEVEPLEKNIPDRPVSIKIHKGLLITTSKQRQATTYNVKNRSGHESNLVIEHPFSTHYRLVSQIKPRERTREVYRFELKVPAGKTGHLEVIEENDRVHNQALSHLNVQAIRVYMQGQYQNEKVQEVLTAALKMQEALVKMQKDLALERQHLQTIAQDQERLRANLREMPSSSAAYKRYLQKFDNQETEIEKLQGRIQSLQMAEQRQRQEIESYFNRIDLESPVLAWPENLTRANTLPCGTEYPRPVCTP